MQSGKTFRIAAHSALEYYGFSHYIPMGKPVFMVALPNGDKQPKWMESKIFDMTFRTFSTTAFPNPEVNTYSDKYGTQYVSSPEQAFLECLLLAPKRYNYVDIYYLMEMLTTLRSNVLQRLLETTTNQRVKRMCLYMAEKAGHSWFNELNIDKIELGAAKMQLLPNGVYNSKYRITVPKELESYEG